MNATAKAYARESASMLSGALFLLAVQTWAAFDVGIVHRRDPQAAQRAVEAEYWNEVYTMIAARGEEE